MIKKKVSQKQAVKPNTESAAPEDLGLSFDLTDDLAMVLKKVRCLFRCRLEWLEHLVDTQANIFEDDEPEAELRWRQQNLQPVLSQLEQYDAALGAIEDSTLNRLISLFGLKPPEVAILYTCLAVRLDPCLKNQLPLVQNQPNQAVLTDYAIARLWCFGRAFSRPSSIPLMLWGLVQVSGSDSALELDPQILDWLLGEHQLHPALKTSSYLVNSELPLSNWPMGQTKKSVDERLQNNEGDGVLIQVAAYPGQGKKTFAAALSKELGLLLLIVDAKNISAAEFYDFYLCAQRQAFLDGCALGWVNLKHTLPTGPLSNFPIQFVFCDKEITGDVMLHKSAIYVELPELNDLDKTQLWKRYLPHHAMWGKPQQAELMRKPVTVADIALAGKNHDRNISALDRRTSQEQQRQLSGLADRLTTPFTRDDWIVNDNITAMFDDFVFEGQERGALWKSPELDRLFPRGKGLIAMLTGPSGTGKTMGAQVAAAELGIELYRVDLSRVVSKYIGETAENLAKIIQRAEKLNVILLFDEADALFSKRTDVKDSIDRHSNMDINYLLQAIEDYSGIAFLATNKKSNIDQSFTRRLRYVVDFPLPEYQQRLQLWQRLIVSLAGDQMPLQYEQICERLAKQIELTGAQIKYAILSALFIAKRMRESLNIQHLIEGITREMQKDGRSLADHERAAILKGLHASQLPDQKVAV